MFQNYMRRLFWLILGVAVSSIGIAMMLQANVGLEPWSVLQQGMSLRTGMTYGTASAIAGAAAILTAVLFGESFGFGTRCGKSPGRLALADRRAHCQATA